jgi:hypothetical protein
MVEYYDYIASYTGNEEKALKCLEAAFLYDGENQLLEEIVEFLHLQSKEVDGDSKPYFTDFSRTQFESQRQPQQNIAKTSEWYANDKLRAHKIEELKANNLGVLDREKLLYEYRCFRNQVPFNKPASNKSVSKLALELLNIFFQKSSRDIPQALWIMGQERMLWPKFVKFFKFDPHNEASQLLTIKCILEGFDKANVNFDVRTLFETIYS